MKKEQVQITPACSFLFCFSSIMIYTLYVITNAGAAFALLPYCIRISLLIHLQNLFHIRSLRNEICTGIH